MGTWGAAVSSNDTYVDVYGDFMELYDAGKVVSEITKLLIVSNQETISDSDDASNLWFALAKAQWLCGALEDEVFLRVKNIIESRDDLTVWRNLGASQKDIVKRELVLKKFLETISTPRSTVRLRRKKIIRQPLYEKGVCLAYKLADGHYAGVIILEAEYDTESGHNLVGITNIYSERVPTMKDFSRTSIPLRVEQNLIGIKIQPIIIWVSVEPKEANIDFHQVGVLPMKKAYSSSRIRFGFTSWRNIENILKLQSIRKRHMVKKLFWSYPAKYFL